MGNPELQPEYTDSYELGFLQNFKTGTFYYGLYHRHTEQTIMRVTYPANENGSTYSRPENLGVNNSVGMEINANKDFKKWYRITGNFNFYHQIISGYAFGENLGTKLVTFSTRINNNFKFQNLFDAQVNLIYRAPQKQPQGKQLSMTGVDVGLSKDIWKKQRNALL